MANARQEAARRAAGYLSNNALYGGSRSDFTPSGNPFGTDDETGESARNFFNRDPNNQTMKAWTQDLYGNALKAGVMTKVDVNYAKEMSPLALDFQKKSQDIASQYNIQEINAQGEQDYRRVKLATDTQREGFASDERKIALTGDQQRKNTDFETKALGERAAMYRANIHKTGRGFYA